MWATGAPHPCGRDGRVWSGHADTSQEGETEPLGQWGRPLAGEAGSGAP